MPAKSPNVKAQPEKYHSAIPGLVVTNATKALEFYQKGLGAKELQRMHGPDGKSVTHAEIQIGDSIVFVGDEMPGMPGARAPKSVGGTTQVIHLYVPDVDRLYEQAVKAGAVGRQPPTDMFWGDRYAQIVDPEGHVWGLATHKEDVPPAELGKRAEAFYRDFAARQRA